MGGQKANVGWPIVGWDTHTMLGGQLGGNTEIMWGGHLGIGYIVNMGWLRGDNFVVVVFFFFLYSMIIVYNIIVQVLFLL